MHDALVFVYSCAQQGRGAQRLPLPGPAYLACGSPAPMESLQMPVLDPTGACTPVWRGVMAEVSALWRGVMAEASALCRAQMDSQVAVSTSLCKTSWKRGIKLWRGQQSTPGMAMGIAPALVPASPPPVRDAKSIHPPGAGTTVSLQSCAFVSPIS